MKKSTDIGEVAASLLIETMCREYWDSILKGKSQFKATFVDAFITEHKLLKYSPNKVIKPVFRNKVIRILQDSLIEFAQPTTSQESIISSVSPLQEEESIPVSPTSPRSEDKDATQRSVESFIDYITDPVLRSLAYNFIEQLKKLSLGKISIYTTQGYVGMKLIGGRKVLTCIYTKQKFFDISAHDVADKWTSFRIFKEADLPPILLLIKASVERQLQK